jgi:hypothetical protein
MHNTAKDVDDSAFAPRGDQVVQTASIRNKTAEDAEDQLKTLRASAPTAVKPSGSYHLCRIDLIMTI